MRITSVRIRPLTANQRPYLIAVASITLDDELIINDIYVYRKHHNPNEYNFIFPNCKSSKEHGECSIVPTKNMRKKIADSITEKINNYK